MHNWSRIRQTDLQPFFKAQKLTSNSVDVILIDRKRERKAIWSGDDFLYGLPVPVSDLWYCFLSKWQHRWISEPNDWIGVPGTWSDFCWDGIRPNLIPWAALKSAWRREAAPLCPNCDEPMVIIGFGRIRTGLCSISPKFTYVCIDHAAGCSKFRTPRDVEQMDEEESRC